MVGTGVGARTLGAVVRARVGTDVICNVVGTPVEGGTDGCAVAVGMLDGISDTVGAAETVGREEGVSDGVEVGIKENDGCTVGSED